MATADERIAELEAQVADLKARLAKRGNHNLEKINAYNATHPDKAAARSKKYKEAHREAYNARRRELYRLKRAADAPTTAVDAPQ
jgi:hypothetical protein